jgi:hypothetical protein
MSSSPLPRVSARSHTLVARDGALHPEPQDISAWPPEPLENMRLQMLLQLIKINPYLVLYPAYFRPWTLGANAYPR